MRPVEIIPGKPAGGSMAIAELRAVSVEFADGTVGLSGSDLSVGAGEFLVLSGVSGAGKSTCLAVLGCRLKATSGTVFFDGVDVAKMTRVEQVGWRRRTSFAAQDSPLLERRTVAENVAYGAEIADRNSADVGERTNGLLARLEISTIANRRPSEVSGGERQRAVLAQALAKQPILLLADEPTSNLDPAAAALVTAILDQHRRAGMTCVVSTHNEPLFAAVATRQVRVVAGRILGYGSPAQPVL